MKDNSEQKYTSEDSYVNKKRLILKILLWLFGLMTVLSLALGIIFQELKILQNIKFIFVIGFALGLAGVFITSIIYRVYVSVSVVKNSAVKETVKKEFKSHYEQWSKNKRSVKIIGWIILVLFIIIAIDAIFIYFSNGKIIFIVIFVVCFLSVAGLAIISNSIIAKAKEEEEKAKERNKNKKSKRS